MSDDQLTKEAERSEENLRSRPDIAAEIAYYIANFGALEMMLHLLLAQMINDDKPRAYLSQSLE